ncbi:potassium channel family protein [Thermodesulfobacteriota bacterium]
MGLLGKTYKDHIIICGLGATALQIIDVLEESREKTTSKDFIDIGIIIHDYVVIDKSEEAIDRIKAKYPKLNYIIGDVTDDDVLEEANIKDAYGIFPVLSSEKYNLYITMAARQMNSSIRIVARTSDVHNIEKKLFKGGASSVVSPNFLGGLRLVSEIARPNATKFLDELLHDATTMLQVAELTIPSDSALSGLSIKAIDLPKKCGLYIIAFKKRGRLTYKYSPSAEEIIEKGDAIVVMGYIDQISNLENLVKSVE